jgi:hypothetical protein
VCKPGALMFADWALLGLLWSADPFPHSPEASASVQHLLRQSARVAQRLSFCGSGRSTPLFNAVFAAECCAETGQGTL